MKIGICSLTVGEVYQNTTKYGRLSKIKYCEKQGYDFIEDETVIDKNRPIPWSKILLIEKYISDYDYIVWLDGDTMIMNDDKKIEEFIAMMWGKEFMAVRDAGGFINTGVWFLKNTEYVKKILRKIYTIDEDLFDTRYWEQSAFNYLYDTDWESLQSHCRDLPIAYQHFFNCTMYDYRHGDFLIHFLGIRRQDWLSEVMDNNCPFKRDDENDESYLHRMEHMRVKYKKR